ncbi:hypothetical protein DY052_07640 [Apilactobacillus timberlakei]|uniref:hypothetical protein n=1 Tax=Apilactobacillus timberlakei TaxID=2008380 RepID=UPI00112BA9BB|nr:hypothetical protein [Apilactobacillus timberlakei]TPR13726.1 hypothetical protein DY052_07640 [Apilactobacillus timberlakei]
MFHLHFLNRSFNNRKDPTLRESKKFDRLSLPMIIIGFLLSILIIWMFANFIINSIEVMTLGLKYGGNIQKLATSVLQSILQLPTYFGNVHTIHTHNAAAAIDANKTINAFNTAKYILFSVLIVMDIYHYIRKVIVPFSMNHNEYGDDKLALPEDVKKETVAVDDRNKNFEGQIGALIMHKFNRRGVINYNVKTKIPFITKYLGINNLHKNIKDKVFYIISAHIAVVILILFILMIKFFGIGIAFLSLVILLISSLIAIFYK